MGEVTGIQWCDHTFNPWIGCQRVSQGCVNCYAEAMAKRFGMDVWANSPRHVTSDAYWRKPLTWDRKAAIDGVRRRVFCASQADVFEDVDDERIENARDLLFGLIACTPHLDWLLLTKRPQVAHDYLTSMSFAETVDRAKCEIMSTMPDKGRSIDAYVGEEGSGYLTQQVDGYPILSNVWLGTSIENQPTVDDRMRWLLKTPAAIRFLSVEPLLGPVDLAGDGGGNDWLGDGDPDLAGEAGIDWVIVGGESGPGARPCHVDWIRDVVRQCKSAGVPVFVKQLGANPVGLDYSLVDRKGGDMSEWPMDLQVREFPKGRA